MTTGTVDPEAVAIERALLEERLDNAQRTHRVRLVGVGFFTLLFLVLGTGLGERSWQTDLRPLVAYLGAAVALVAAARVRRVAPWLTLAPAVLDAPLVYVVQVGQYPTTPNPAAVAGFSMGLFALLLIIASLSMPRWQVNVTALVVIGWEVRLQADAGLGLGAWLSATAVLALVAGLLAWANGQRSALLVKTSRTEKLAALGQLSAGVGHDLRNPLAAITSALFVLRRRLDKAGALEGPAAEPLALAEREVEACQRIVTDLLDYARETTLELAPVPLEPLLRECASLVRTPPEVTVELQLPADLPAPSAERGRLRQVFTNLLQNGVEAIPPGRPGRVTVTGRATPGGVELSVRDDGVGMSEQTRRRLFEPLFTTKKQGTGLGLAIVESLVRQHGGRLGVESAPGQGATFTVALPLMPPAAR